MNRIGRHMELVWGYGKWILAAGMVFNAVCAGFLAAAFSYVGVVDAWILKLAFTAVVLYLHRLLEDRDAIFFYINLGLSRKCLMAWTLGIDFGLLALLETVIALCQ